MKDKIELLMEETGCDRGEAELALEMCGYQVEEAVRQIPRLLRDICALKGKFTRPGVSQHGLFLVVLNLKTRKVLRARAVMSYDPAVCGVGLEADWFAFEKHLYGCRLWDGSLPAESLELEQSLAAFYRSAAGDSFERLREPGTDNLPNLTTHLREHFNDAALRLRVKKDILDLGQFQSLKTGPEPAARKAKIPRGGPREEDLLVLKVELEPAEEGSPAAELHAGDLVYAKVADARDIAQYLARLFGGLTASGPVPIEAPVEAVETSPKGTLVRVRFAVGVAGDALIAPETRVRSARAGALGRDGSWWKRLFNG